MNVFQKGMFLITFLFCGLNLNSQQISFSNNWGKNGFNLTQETPSNVEIIFSVEDIKLEEIVINGILTKNIQLNGTILPNDEGAPNLPGTSRYIAIPNGATASYELISSRTETIHNIEIAPAPKIPLDTDNEPLVYQKDESIYSQNANYPKNPIKLSAPQKIRGINVVMLGITPFQYNPITKDLVIFTDLKIEVTFSDGNGHFGEDRLRSRWWDSTVKNLILNKNSLPEIDYHFTSNSRTEDFEYLIITLDSPIFLAWADSIKQFRTLQGIRTGVVTTSEIGGNTVSAIKNYIDNAYYNWDIPPAAVLLMADFSTGANGITSQYFSHPAGYPDYISDNHFADVTGDDLPDIAFARMTANDEEELEVMVTKFMNYERNPSTNPDFYHHPITALGWQTERWFQICSEIIGGYFRNVHAKNPIRINTVYEGNPDVDPWSIATNTEMVTDYFGPDGLGYIPATPQELGGFSGGSTADVINAINDGAFLLQHRDHGSYNGWGEPAFSNSNINSLTNINNELPFIFSINCQTGAFHNPEGSESFAEKFHRYTYDGQNSGALGLLAATEVSFSFVNDTFVWGVYDNMYPDFMPDNATVFPVSYIMPAFANVAGKYFLEQSSWPYVPEYKQITYRLFHHHGDAFTTIYSEVPQNLTVIHDEVLFTETIFFEVTANEGTLICLTVNGEIIGIGEGTGAPVAISIPPQTPIYQMIITVTKQNYFRHTSVVQIIPPEGAYVIHDSYTINDANGNNNNEADFDEEITLNTTLKNVGVNLALDVEATISTSDIYANITDNYQTFGTMQPSATATQNNAFTLNLADDVPDQHTVDFDLEVTGTSGRDVWNSTFSITVNAPEINIGNLIIDDSAENNNGRLDPGETVNIIIPTANDGHANSPFASGILTCEDEYITINSGTFDFGEIDDHATIDAIFNITTAPNTPLATIISFDYNVDCGNYSNSISFAEAVGLIVEDFETDGFSQYPWEFVGTNWYISTEAYEETYSAQSANINDNQTSTIKITLDVLAVDEISFFYKVSSEANYDYLKFYIDDNLQDQWAGEIDWTQANFAVNIGEHTFKWEYCKDGSVGNGSDCAWIDFIVFPPIGVPEPPNFVIIPETLDIVLEENSFSTENIYLSNTGGGNINYSIYLVETTTSREITCNKTTLFDVKADIAKKKRIVDGSYIPNNDVIPNIINPVYLPNSRPTNVTITCDGGSWQSEISWEILDSFGTVVASGGAPFNQSASLDNDTYTVNAADDYGDGWNGNYLTIVGDDGNEYCNYTLESGSAGSTTFEIDTPEPVSWLSLMQNSGSLSGDETDEITLIINATDLPTGSVHTADIVILNNLGNSVIIPITLSIDNEQIIYGDVDGNGIVQAMDTSLTLQNVVNLIEFEEWQIIAGDVDLNGEIQAMDASYILQYVVGIIDELPIETGRKTSNKK
ncbi:MAG: hypothetical protein HN952_06115 [Candidatus Cloacimonetes bacterium]|jgi:hypothetical protein|nr:hypothetical protein [Candidatus Cloacimonadota bacterium]MBT6994514.1 hypothetical protein [Candidatus Cloacimonadota bacterium]MBT7469875.1 hypothetical protein [Candidatus Cloacimonadota bacterium]